MMCLNTEVPKTNLFSFVTNGKVMVLGVPILKHFRVLVDSHIMGVFGMNQSDVTKFYLHAKLMDNINSLTSHCY